MMNETNIHTQITLTHYTTHNTQNGICQSCFIHIHNTIHTFTKTATRLNQMAELINKTVQQYMAMVKKRHERIHHILTQSLHRKDFVQFFKPISENRIILYRNYMSTFIYLIFVFPCRELIIYKSFMPFLTSSN